MSVRYRYSCGIDGIVYETRSISDPVPTVCAKDGSAIITGTLTIVKRPNQIQDLIVKDSADFSNSNVNNLSHAQLSDIGINTHAEIDIHINDLDKHRVINDTGSSSTDLWSAAKITSELLGKSDLSHNHVAADITDFDMSVANNSNVSNNTTHRTNTNNPHNVTKSQIGLSNVLNHKNKWDGTTAPTPNDDTNEGYQIGSLWVNTTDDNIYMLANASATNAIWVRVSLSIDDSRTGTDVVWSSTKLNATFSEINHGHVSDDITNFDTSVTTLISNQKGNANGLATLDGNSKIPTAQLPDLSISSVHVVDNITARDSLAAQEGDFAVVTDSDGNGNPNTYIYTGTAWQIIQVKGDVLSVAGKTGAVILNTDDITEGNNLYYSDTRVSNNANVSANTSHRSATNNPHNVTIEQLTSSLEPGNGQILEYNGSNWQATYNPKFIISSENDIVDLTEWTTVDQFIYPGSSISPSKVTRILVNAFCDPGISFDIRISYLSGNNLFTLGTSTGNNNNSPQVINLGTLANIPSTDVILEVQIKRVTGNAGTFCRYLSTMLEYR